MEKSKMTDDELMEQLYQIRERTYGLMGELKSAFDELFNRTTDFIEQKEVKTLKTSTLHHLDSALTNYSDAIAWLDDHFDAQRNKPIEVKLSQEEIESNKAKIEAFNKQNAPFYIVDHEDGEFSLCLPFSLTRGEYANFGQEAFNRYAASIGEDAVNERGFYTHGDGYEWETVFKKAFEHDPHIGEISFDCEAGGFFCYGQDLDVVADLGHRFRELCMDDEAFAEVVYNALTEDESPTMTMG